MKELMSKVWKLAELDIIGYADVRERTLLPAIVPPVFQLRIDRDVVLLPPYKLDRDVVAGATSVSLMEAEQLKEAGKLTFLSGGAMKAADSCQLWLHRDGRMHYQPIHEAKRTMEQLGRDAMKRAIVELKDGRIDQAEVAASEAILYNDSPVEPYAIKAAIRRRQGNLAGEQLMAELARPVDPAAFAILVDHYSGNATPVQPALVRPDNRSVMDHIASIPVYA